MSDLELSPDTSDEERKQKKRGRDAERLNSGDSNNTEQNQNNLNNLLDEVILFKRCLLMCLFSIIIFLVC